MTETASSTQPQDGTETQGTAESRDAAVVDEREVFPVAVTVFCEARGVDEQDATSAATLAVTRALHAAAVPAHQAMALPSAGAPQCAHCGLRGRVTKSGKLASHARGEDWVPRSSAERCPGAGQPPRVPDEPVVAAVFPNGHRILARIHNVMGAGMALANDYLWSRPTSKGFR